MNVSMYIHIYRYISWVPKCFTKTLGCGTSHEYTNIQVLQCKIHASYLYYILRKKTGTKNLIWKVPI
jgi:hypothetical protein